MVNGRPTTKMTTVSRAARVGLSMVRDTMASMLLFNLISTFGDRAGAWSVGSGRQRPGRTWGAEMQSEFRPPVEPAVTPCGSHRTASRQRAVRGRRTRTPLA